MAFYLLFLRASWACSSSWYTLKSINLDFCKIYFNINIVNGGRVTNSKPDLSAYTSTAEIYKTGLFWHNMTIYWLEWSTQNARDEVQMYSWLQFTLYTGCVINTNTKDHKDENTSMPAEAVNWLAYIKRFLHRYGFPNTVCGPFLSFWVGSCAQSPFWQPHPNGFLMLCWIIDPAKCASSMTMKKASCRFFHTFSFKKQGKNL